MPHDFVLSDTALLTKTEAGGAGGRGKGFSTHLNFPCPRVTPAEAAVRVGVGRRRTSLGTLCQLVTGGESFQDITESFWLCVLLLCVPRQPCIFSHVHLLLFQAQHLSCFHSTDGPQEEAGEKLFIHSR